MSHLRAYVTPAYWRHGFSLGKASAAILSALGTLWLIVQIVTYYRPEWNEVIAKTWPLFLAVGAVSAIWVNRPVRRIRCKLKGRDVELCIAVGDLFSFPGALVVGSNTSFDTDVDAGLIAPGSVQGQFTSRYYEKVPHLDRDLEQALNGVPFSPAAPAKKGKRRLYPMGTTARVAANGRTAYLSAIASFNPLGNAFGSFEDLKTALPQLWDFIINAGTLEPVVMPVLGSGYSRVPEKRDEIVREIVNSFIAACASSRFTESLTIVLRPQDVYRHDVDVVELGRYLEHVCRYAEYSPGSRRGPGVGTT